MVEQVERLSADVETEALGKIDAFRKREIEIVNRSEREGVTPGVGARARARNNVARIRIIRHVGHNVGASTYLTEGIVPGDPGSYCRAASRINDGSVPRRIAIEIGVDAA